MTPKEFDVYDHRSAIDSRKDADGKQPLAPDPTRFPAVPRVRATMKRRFMPGTAKIVLSGAVMIVLASCAGSSQPATTEGTQSTTVTESDSPTSGDVDEATAETAANLVVGPNGPGYGDRDGDGEVGGSTSRGVLPGIDGSPPWARI